MGTQLQGNRKMKKYQAGMDVEGSPRPKMRPEDMEKMAARKKMRPKARPAKKMPPKSIGGGMGEGTRGVDPKDNYSDEDLKRLAGGMPKMKKGGKVRGYGKARGGKACKMR